MSNRIKYEDYKVIQDLKRQGYNKRQVYLKSGIRQPTVAKYWSVSEDEYFELSYDKAMDVDKYREFLVSHIKMNPDIKDVVLLTKIVEEFGDDTIKKATFYRYTTKLRAELGLERKNVRKFMLTEHRLPGECMQVDGGEKLMIDMYGNKVRVYFIAFILSYSRMRFVYFQNRAFNTADLITAHEYAFKYYGGRAETMMYDQAKIVVSNETAGNIVFASEFEEYIKHCGFAVYLCKKRDPSTKGQVENTVRVIKMGFMENREYCGMSALNSQALKWLDTICNERPNSHTLKTPREMFEVESRHLIQVKPYNNTKMKIATVDGASALMYKNNFYVLPSGMKNKNDKVLVIEDMEKLIVLDEETNQELTSFDIQKSKGGISKKVDFAQSNMAENVICRLVNNDERLLKLIDGIKQNKPRFIHEQCVILKKIYDNYTEQEFFEGVEHCNAHQKFCTTEIVVYLVMKYGIERVAKVINYRSKYDYIARAEKLKIELYGGKND